ncbi:aminodeoxychorismate synthase component I [Pelagibaculum spongiae]|uniref:aminodeoxychorismate synthase component I n=1 Tax=Pelagibaculum spongiae TaxID=2080658 RepID=UPI0013140D08|nr:aminodeoxychorismate synthase component I [Pelagibaculum spongiae]
MRLSLPYREDASSWFDHFAKNDWAIFLDSCQPNSQDGDLDIIAAQPWQTLWFDQNGWTLEKHWPLSQGKVNPETAPIKQTGTENPWQKLQQLIQQCPETAPLHGAVVGYWGYHIDQPKQDRDSWMPQMAVGFYDWLLVTDHKNKTCQLMAAGVHINEQQLIDIKNDLLKKSSNKYTDFKLTSEPTNLMSKQQYQNHFEKIKKYLKDGDCYQVNLTQAFEAKFTGDSWSAYQQLRKKNPAPFSAFIRTPHGSLVSCSPERFLKLDQQQVETKPIKGTRPRGKTPQQDLLLKQQLQASQKDQAENLMIVDLLRNDLGMSCTPGSIHVPGLFEIESFANVHHLVSTIRGKLDPKQSPIELLQHAFPGGSITGAPKKRSMEIINELEAIGRSIYCGSIGYIDFSGKMDTSITIRTAICSDDTIRWWGGGGIVYDSKVDEEYQESFDKVDNIARLLKAM